MLGEQIMTFQAKMTGRRVLPCEGTQPSFESTFEFEGTARDQPVKGVVTYWATIRPNGTLYGECPGQGFMMTQAGHTATYRGAGAGKFTNAAGAMAFRGTLFFESAAKGLAWVNGLAVVYEWDIDENGAGKFQGWEWK